MEPFVTSRQIGLRRSQLIGNCRRGFAKRVLPPMLPWMSEHIRFPVAWEAKSFDLWKMPHVRGFIERFWLDPRKRKANLPWSVRSGKTTTLLAVMCYVAECDPAPMGILFPDRGMLQAAKDEHIYPMLERTRVIARQLLPSGKRNSKAIVFRDCRARLANAGTLSDASGWPAKYIFKFEHDKCPVSKRREADASRRIESRTAGYARGVKIVEESSPEPSSTSRAVRMLRSKTVQQLRFQVPCPHCAEYQALEFKQLKIPREAIDACDATMAFRESRYHCAECDCVIEDYHRAAMMQAGLWVIEGEWVDGTGRICGTPTVDSDTMVFGHYSMLYSLFVESFGTIAREFVDALGAQRDGDSEAVKKFYSEVLAMEWEDKPATVSHAEIAVHLRGTHNRGKAPAETAFLTTSADVGLIDETLIFHWMIMAWWRGGQGAVVDWGLAVGVDEFLKVVNGTKVPLMGSPVKLPLNEFPIGLDSGKYSTEVYSIADMMPTAVALKGDSRTDRSVNVDLYYPGTRKSGIPAALVAMKKRLGVDDLVMVNSEMSQRYRQALFSKRMHPGYTGFVTFPVEVCDAPDEFEAWWDQFQSDYREKSKWVKSGPNEAGDTLRYGRVLAERYTRNGLHWKTVQLAKRWLNIEDSKQRVAPEAGRKRRKPAGNGYLISNRGK